MCCCHDQASQQARWKVFRNVTSHSMTIYDHSLSLPISSKHVGTIQLIRSYKTGAHGLSFNMAKVAVSFFPSFWLDLPWLLVPSSYWEKFGQHQGETPYQCLFQNWPTPKSYRWIWMDTSMKPLLLTQFQAKASATGWREGRVVEGRTSWFQRPWINWIKRDSWGFDIAWVILRHL